MKTRTCTGVLIGLVCLLLSTSAYGHGKFGTLMKSYYGLKSVRCEACHVEGKKKDQLGPFGKVVAEPLDARQIERKLKEVKHADEATKEKVYDEIDRLFIEALKRLDKLTAPSGKTYAEAIRAGEIPELKP